MTSATASRRAPVRVTTVPSELPSGCPSPRWMKKPPDRAMIPASRSNPAGHRTPFEYPVQRQEVVERQHEQHSGVCVPGPEELPAELPEIAASGEETEQSPTTVLHAHQGQQHDDGQHIGRFHAVITALTCRPLELCGRPRHVSYLAA